MQNTEMAAHVHQVLDVRARLRVGPTGEPEHSHSARGLRVQTSAAGPERIHFHRTSAGTTDAAPNRPGHRHRMPTGTWTDGSSERWSSIGVGRM